MTRIGLVLLLARSAWADPPCSMTEEPTAAARTGIEAAHIHRFDAPADPHAVGPLGEVEGGAWVTQHTALTGVAGSYTVFHYTSSAGDGAHVTLGRVGARVTDTEPVSWNASGPTCANVSPRNPSM